MTETTTRKRGPESPEARIARADRVAQEMTTPEREDLLTLLSVNVETPEEVCDGELARAVEARDFVIQTARENFTAEKARIGRRSSVAAIYASLDPQYQARLLRQLRAITDES